jgi:diguanylate cyclase (GGDEF)-like protein
LNITLPAPFRQSPASRVAIGLVALMVSLLLLCDLFVTGFMPDHQEDARRHRLLAAELIATQVLQAVRDHREDDLRALLATALHYDPELHSAAVLSEVSLLAVVGDHAHRWQLLPGAPSTLENLRTPLLADGQRWGELQLAFTPAGPANVGEWLEQPIVLGVALMTILGFVAFQLYLRRAMRYLDPSAAVPERVRTAFETLTEAVLVLDVTGRVMLANKAFLSLRPDAAKFASLTGLSVNELDWLTGAVPPKFGRPWDRVLETNSPVLSIEMRFGTGTGRTREVVMNCSPINDGFHRARGCLLTFSDVTELHERTEGLRVALAELHTSREEIRLKNEELTLLATRDALTGCLNRRAFLAESEHAIEAATATKTPLCCIMCDVDHFKSINDRFGHGGGDEVLKAISKTLARGLRNGDLLSRYGGEEFCVMLPGASLEIALVIAERLRVDVEANAGSAVRHLADVKVTMSFGVEQLGPDAAQFATLVDRADKALYHSKQNGRNQVKPYASMAQAS